MNTNLELLRKQIDVLDRELLHIIAKRMDVVDKIGELKIKLGLPATAKKRRQQVLQFYISHAKKLGLSKNLVQKLYDLIHEHSLKIESKIK